MTADPWVEIPGLLNFRAVRPGLYRTDTLSQLAGGDSGGRAAYAALGVHTVIDLRRSEEVEAHGRAPEWACAVWHHVTLREPPWPVADGLGEAAVARYLADIYLGTTEAGGEDIVRVLTILADPATGPAVVHCAGGRDRTGVVIALILGLLSVPDEEIAFEYALTQEFTKRWIAWHAAETGRQPDLPANVRYTPASAMTQFLGDLRARHGSVEGYLLSKGLSAAAVEALRERYR